MDAASSAPPNFARLLTASGATTLLSPKFAQHLDNRTDPLAHFRQLFCIPTRRKVGCKDAERADELSIYLCGNSLGPMPRKTPELVAQELMVWSEKGVLGHFDHPLDRPWLTIDDTVTARLAKLVGAKKSEVACMGTLTSNLHLLLMSFYKPTKERYKILFEEKCFPSDMYAFASQVEHHHHTREALIPLAPRKGEYVLRTQDILDTIKREGQAIALVMFSGVQYYTGQCFDMAKITTAARAQGCMVGFDLAHAIGNVPLRLHDWDVDFAVWCSYKYLCSGPGGIAGIFVHEKHDGRKSLAGWWGHNVNTRFKMPAVFEQSAGAAGFQLSNPCVLSTMSLLGGLQVFGEAGGDMIKIRKRSELLTGYLEVLLRASAHYIPVEGVGDILPDAQPCFTIITPSERGAQLSLIFLPSQSGTMQRAFHSLLEAGVVGDERDPDVIRLSPVALYNTFNDVREAAIALEIAMDNEVSRWRSQQHNGQSG